MKITKNNGRYTVKTLFRQYDCICTKHNNAMRCVEFTKMNGDIVRGRVFRKLRLFTERESRIKAIRHHIFWSTPNAMNLLADDFVKKVSKDMPDWKNNFAD